jgi:4-amino-4-deoxy-L-arabinose transferase-like glycosyltransferase
MNSNKKIIIFFAFISLLISAGHVLNLNYNKPDHDRSHYLAYAYNTLKHGIYSRDRSENPSPDLRREPVWPLFLVIAISLHPSIDLNNYNAKCIAKGEDKCIENITWLKLVNILFLMLSALIAFYIIFQISNNVFLSFISFLMISLSGTLGKYAVSFYNEILTALLILIVSYSLHNLVNNTYSKKRTFIFGLLLGILVLTKAIFYYFVFISGFCLFLYWIINRVSLRHSLYGITILLVAAFIIIVPWKVRNYINFKTFSLADRSGIVLLTRSYFNEYVSQDYIGSVILYSSRVDWVKKNIETVLILNC